MGEIRPALDINATKKLAPHTPENDAQVPSGVQRDQLAAGHRHAGTAHFGLENQPSGRATVGL